MIHIDQKTCTQCSACFDVCRAHVFENSGRVSVAKPEECIQCGFCMSVCPSAALTHSRMPAESFQQLPKHEISTDALADLMYSRRSTRCYKDTPVPKECIEKLIDVAIHAGNGSNLQLENILVLNDRAFLDELETRVMNVFWNRGMRFFKEKGPLVRILSRIYGKELTASYQQYHRAIKQWKKDKSWKGNILFNAPLLVIIHGQKANRINQANCAIAIRNMELLALTMGLSSCWSGWLMGAAGMSGSINRYLGLDRTREIGGTLVLGYPKHTSRVKVPRNTREVRWFQ